MEDRSRPSGWTIATHVHANLSHVIFIETGAGEARFDGELVFFVSPVLLLIPARVVHAFRWRPESCGRVLTIADGYADELFVRVPSIRPLFDSAGVLPVRSSTPEEALLRDSLLRLSQELAWNAPGQRAAIEATLITFLVEVLRLACQEADEIPPGRQAATVARFREAVEKNFCRRYPLEHYSKALGVTAAQLRSACAKVARKAPLQILQDRVLVEAKRLLLYSNMSISEVAYYLGFDDAAYFSRLFQRRAGVSPRGFRQSNCGSADGTVSTRPPKCRR